MAINYIKIDLLVKLTYLKYYIRLMLLNKMTLLFGLDHSLIAFLYYLHAY